LSLPGEEREEIGRLSGRIWRGGSNGLTSDDAVNIAKPSLFFDAATRASVQTRLGAVHTQGKGKPQKGTGTTGLSVPRPVSIANHRAGDRTRITNGGGLAEEKEAGGCCRRASFVTYLLGLSGKSRGGASGRGKRQGRMRNKKISRKRVQNPQTSRKF